VKGILNALLVMVMSGVLAGLLVGAPLGSIAAETGVQAEDRTPAVNETSDWRGRVVYYLQKAGEFAKLSAYLERILPAVPEPDKPDVLLLLCYAGGQAGDWVMEKKWLDRYMADFRGLEPELQFLNRRERVKVFEYIQRRLSRYPGVKSVQVGDKSRRVHYFFVPATFYLDVDAYAPSEVTVTVGNQVLYSGYLDKGMNTLPLPFEPAFKQSAANRLLIGLKNQSIEVSKAVVLTARFHYPAGMRFDPLTGETAFTDREFKAEESRQVLRETRRYFDKKHFMKKALPALGIGIAGTLLDRLAFAPAVDGDNATPGSRAVLNGLSKTTLVVSVGFSLKGIVSVVKSFKKDVTHRELRVKDPEAAAYNSQLKKELEEARQKVSITYSILAAGEEK